MSKLTYGEHLYNYLSGLDYEGLNFEEAEARDWVSEVEALVRVAREAKAYQNFTLEHWARNYKHPDDYEDVRRDLSGQLIEALKEVEHLL